MKIAVAAKAAVGALRTFSPRLQLKYPSDLARLISPLSKPISLPTRIKRLFEMSFLKSKGLLMDFVSQMTAWLFFTVSLK